MERCPPVLRGVWFQSAGRDAWPSVEPGRNPPKRREPIGRGVWDFTCNHEAAGFDVWLKPVPSSSSAKAR